MGRNDEKALDMLEISRTRSDKMQKIISRITEGRKLTLDNDTFENTGKSRFFERRTSRVLY